MPISGPQAADRNDSLRRDGVARDVDNVEPNESKMRQADLQLERLLPDGVEGVSGCHLGFVFAAVAGKTNHLKLISFLG